MKIEIQGQTLESFLVVITDGSQVQPFDIHSLLTVDDDNLDCEIRDSATNEHWWHQLALTAEHDLEEFEKTWYNQYAAHTEKYAAYYLKGQGEKNPTGASKEKCAILLFSEGADEEANASIAWLGYKEIMDKIGIKPKGAMSFREDMYSYEQSMQEIERIRLSKKHMAAQLRAVFSAFSTKSWSIKTRLADKRAMLSANV
jgi:hypothetical protein